MIKSNRIFNIIINIVFIVALMIPLFLEPFAVDAADNRTIKTILSDIEKQKKALTDKQNQQNLTEAQIKTVKSNISLIDASIKKGQQDIIDLNNEIAKLEIEIKAKDEELRKIMVFLQVSEGESEYLEYVFGATNFTDFIYRMAITEQLTDYNNRLINEYNAMIESNKKKASEIKDKEAALQVQASQLQSEIAKLSAQVSTLSKEQGDLADGIAKSEAQIRALIADGCDEDETVDACYSRLRTLPSDTEFWRPSSFGNISSLFGWRSYYIGSSYYEDFHYGLDIALPSGTPLYAVANGQIASRQYWPGTGYVIYVYHKVNGVKYTSVYEHLSSYANLAVGSNVTKDTVVAYSGNTGQSSGPHLHISIITGWAGLDYSYWGSTYMSSNLDPKTKINFPAGYGSFTTRNRNCSLGAC